MRQGRSRPSPDHMWPRSKGGRLGLNIVYVCHQCNQDKWDTPIFDWLEKLKAANDPRVKHVSKFIEEAPTKIHMNWREWMQGRR